MLSKRFLVKCYICKQNLLQRVCNSFKLFVSTTSTRSLSETLEACYSDIDKNRILKIINNCELDTLSRFKIAKNRIKEIVQHRNKIGQFNSLTEVEEISGFSDRSAKAFFNSIINLGTEGGEESKEKIVRVNSRYLYPSMSAKAEEKVASVTSVYVNTNSVSWSLIDTKTYKLQDWGIYEAVVKESKKPQLHDIILTAWSASQAIPQSDVYVMENPATTLRSPGADPNNPRLLNINLQREQLAAALVAMLTVRHQAQRKEGHTNTLEHVVYFLKATLAPRLFRTFVGTERVSTESTVRSIFTSNDGVTIPLEQQQLYNAQMEKQREVLGQCLLINLAFMEVCFYKNAESLKNLNSRD